MEQFQHPIKQYFIMANYTGIAGRIQPKMVYPEDIELVVDATPTAGAIYVGNLEASQNVLTLKKYGIKAVLTAASGACLSHPKSEVPFYKYIPGEDHQRFDLSQYFEECILFMQESLKQTNILVHCMAGISRSVTLVIAYLIKCHGLPYDTAYSMVKSRRKIIHPNDGFIDQLKKYQREVKRDSPPKTRYESPFRKNDSPIKRFAEYESPSRRTPESLYSNHGLELGASARVASPSKLYASPTRHQYQSPVRAKYESPLKHSQAYDRSGLGGLLEGNSRLLKDYNEVRTPDRIADSKPYMNGLSPLSTKHQLHGHSHSVSTNHYRNKPEVENRRQDPQQDLDKKIADIRKKYSEYNENIKARLSDDDSLGYRPSGPALRHMKSMNYEQPQPTTEYPSSYLKSQIDNYMQEPPRLALRKQATMYQRPNYGSYGQEPY